VSAKAIRLIHKSHRIPAIPSLYCVQTLTSQKAATGLSKNLPESRSSPLNVLLQVNTSGEDSKSGVPPLNPSSDTSSSELLELATHVMNDCPRLHLLGLMTIGSISESLDHEKPNQDFETLKETRSALQIALEAAKAEGKLTRGWGADGRLQLSMGMSSDFEDAIKAGSDFVRVGTGIFGSRKTKEEAKAST
jgi:pyridoxal phosphate enzyme (YggS family)